jgi:hypothetical protein
MVTLRMKCCLIKLGYLTYCTCSNSKETLIFCLVRHRGIHLAQVDTTATQQLKTG